MINYKLISDSIFYFQSKGFIRIETPWMVPSFVDKITRPSNIPPYQIKNNDECLVGSGEQSFLFLYLNETLPMGKFQTVTPCFRDDNVDFFHKKYFIKNELIQTDIVNNIELEKMIEYSLKFLKKEIPNVMVVQTQDGFDIEYNGIELGSYGIRETNFLRWIYGTGCAEPRLSNTIKQINNGLS